MSDEEERPQIGRVKLQKTSKSLHLPSLPDSMKSDEQMEEGTIDLQSSLSTEEMPPPAAAPAPEKDVPGNITIQVETTRIKINFEALCGVLSDPAAYIWWADVLARAERELIVLESTLRYQRGRSLASMSSKLKVAEATALIEGGPNWLSAKNAIAEATRNAVLLREIVALFRARSS